MKRPRGPEVTERTNGRKSAELRVKEISKVMGEKGGCVETGGCVEVPPNVRKSAESRAMGISKVKEDRKVDV